MIPQNWRCALSWRPALASWFLFGLAACAPEEEVCPAFVDACRPANLAPFTVEILDAERSVMATQQLALTQLDDDGVSFSSIIDGATGDPRFWYAPEPDSGLRIIRTRMGLDGDTLTIGLRPPDNRNPEGFVVRVDRATGEELSRTAANDHHHDHVELPDGRLAFLSRVRVPDKWFGRKEPLASDVLSFAEEGGESEVVVDLLTDLGIEPFWPCTHMGPGGFVRGALDWTHTNSFVVHPESNTVTLGIRHFDAVVRIDLATRKVVWWLGATLGGIGGFGNPGALSIPGRLRPMDGAHPPRHGHFSEVWEDGLVLFDNGNHDPDPVTRLVEYAIDAEAGTYREVWSYAHPEGAYYGARGDVIRLPGGHRLVAWTPEGELWELTPDGTVVWTAKTTHKVLRMVLVEDSAE